MKGYYGLSKEDPLVALHLKIPTSIRAALWHEAKQQGRYPAEVVRNILIRWEKETRLERQESAGVTGGSGGGSGSGSLAENGKRKRA